MPSANPVLFYHPEGYEVARKDLKGRHSAGESFLSAFLEQATEPEVYALCAGKESAAQFARAVKASGRPLTPRPIGRGDIETLRRQGVLNLPGPGIGGEALTRSFLGDSAYALCGVTHTISSREVLESVASIPVAPVTPWDALICTSQAVHDALSGVLAAAEEHLRQRIGATRFVRPMMPILPLGVHAARFSRKPADRARWRARLGIGDDEVAVLFFGRLSVHAKASPFQLAQAVEAAAKAAAKRFAIIWCGWFNDDFQRRVFMNTAKSMAPAVAFHHVDGRDADARFSIWAAADIFCSLSDNIQESFGLTVVEAMAAELPVVVSNWNGYRAAVEHGVNGVMIDSYLPEVSLADAAYRYISGADSYDLHVGTVSQLCFVDTGQAAQWIARLAADEPLRASLARAARKTVESAFDWSVVLPRYAELWREQSERVARSRASANASSSAWRLHDPARTFAGFPSHRLAGEAKLERGPQFSRCSELVKHPGVILNASVLTGGAQYQAMQKAFAQGRPRTVQELLAGFSDIERPALLRTLHWMLKVGLLQLHKQ